MPHRPKTEREKAHDILNQALLRLWRYESKGEDEDYDYDREMMIRANALKLIYGDGLPKEQR